MPRGAELRLPWWRALSSPIRSEASEYTAGDGASFPVMSWPRGEPAKSGCLIVGALLAAWDVDDDKHNGERQGFSYWSGYTPGKSNPDETVTPLNRDELRVEAGGF